ncbi:MAG: RtcB family protein [Alphaproteobacteria bacterium]
MELSRFEEIAECAWRFDPVDAMHVPVVVFADRDLLGDMDDMVLDQATGVASLPGIVEAAYVMPDAHRGYGFPIGGVAAYDPDRGGIISGGGVGFDISCGVRMLVTSLSDKDVQRVAPALADALLDAIPAGVGSHSDIALSPQQMDLMLRDGARWAVESGYGAAKDLERIEENGCMPGARPDLVSTKAKKRQVHEMGTLGSGNHYLEVQRVDEIFDADVAETFGLSRDRIVVSIHCGSRGLGHQIGTEYLREMADMAPTHGITLPNRELACAPIHSDLGQRYLGAMRAGINCALANRQVLTHFTRTVFAKFFPSEIMPLLFDVSHNTCKVERHQVDGQARDLFVHRKGATCALGPRSPGLPADLRLAGQPVLIGGSMGTGSYVLVGGRDNQDKGFASACHGAGRVLSRHAAKRKWGSREVVDSLAAGGILIRARSTRGISEEAPGAYKDVDHVVDVADKAGLSRKVARVRPLICIKG